MTFPLKHWMTATIKAAAGVALLTAAGVASAQGAFPTRPVTLVIPFSAGGPTDVVARMLAGPMGRSLGQTVVVDNATGAGGTIAASKVARAAPDGHTVFLHHMGMSTAPYLYRKLNFDPLKDFAPIGEVLDVPMTLLARKDFPARDGRELLSHVKAQGNKITLANAGLGAVSHLCGLLFMSQLGVELTTVPYKGTGPALTDLLGGQVDLLCDQTTQTVPYIKDGRVKVYGVTVPQRLSALPDVPTLDEQGLKGFEIKVWHGLYAPRGTPPEAIAKLNTALKAALADPAVVKRMDELNADIPSAERITPESLRRHLQAELAKWGPVIKQAGIHAD
ncbi:MAG: tripartite tricarboxylate transporter substrate binding protein BugD [Pseudomonadota bacterium]|nr:tripartite tricarboxylate transporter substrate binding protein BugD [Pseudomonadota bacterium]